MFGALRVNCLQLNTKSNETHKIVIWNSFSKMAFYLNITGNDYFLLGFQGYAFLEIQELVKVNLGLYYVRVFFEIV